MAIRKRATTVPAPFVVSPSQNFHGPDGSWSTFQIQVGTPPQSFDILASTSSSENWVPLPEGCTASDPSDCASLRGVQPFNGNAASGYQTNQSSTWSLTGLYALDLETHLGLTGNGQYGTDVLGLNGGNGSSTGGISLAEQTIAGIAAKDYLLGILGLGIRPTSFSSSSPLVPSLMSTMKDSKVIPSLSYGYTAGASYRNKKVMANLVLGGYDQSRFTPSNKSFSFASQDADVLTVGVQSIVAEKTLLGTTSFTSGGNGHLSVIDSTVPHLWLPRAICDLMESALGLQYDNASDLYLVNDTIHAQLQANNPTFTFKIGDKAFDNGNSTNIQLPYAAFDLQVGWPIYSSNQNYFPIRRAANSTQYTLGRTLLQEAYLVVDYERRNFTLGQAVFMDPMPTSHVVAVTSAGNTSSGSKGISTGAIVGIAIGAAVLIIGAIIAFIFFHRRRKNRQTTAELEAIAAKRASERADPKYGHLDSDATELATDREHRISEMPSDAGDHKHRPHSFATELPSPHPVYEMAGDHPIEMMGDTPQHTPRNSVPPSPYNPNLSPNPYAQRSPQPSPRLQPGR